jgi:hypothetical protein
MTNQNSCSMRFQASLGRATVCAVVALWTAHALHAAPPADPKDRGVYVFAMAGRQIGSESFEIRSKGGRVEAEAQTELRVQQEGKTVEFKTTSRLTLTSELQPLNYEWSQKGSQSSHLQIDLQTNPAVARYQTVSGEEDVREFQFPGHVVILDNNAIHHYQLVVHRFRNSGGRRQTFHAFIPQEALPGSLTIEDVGPEPVDVGGREQRLQHLVVTTDNARIELWVDGRDRLQKITIPAAELEVVRRK